MSRKDWRLNNFGGLIDEHDGMLKEWDEKETEKEWR
jgi:hypothetical protein